MNVVNPVCKPQKNIQRPYYPRSKLISFLYWDCAKNQKIALADSEACFCLHFADIFFYLAATGYFSNNFFMPSSAVFSTAAAFSGITPSIAPFQIILFCAASTR